MHSASVKWNKLQTKVRLYYLTFFMTCVFISYLLIVRFSGDERFFFSGFP